MFDIHVLALQADLTRVITFMMGREASLRCYPELGVPQPHHPLTHHRGEPDSIEKVTKINIYHAELFAWFLNKLKATADGDRTLLYNSMIVYSSGISDGNAHNHEDLPCVFAGHGGGAVKQGHHIVFKKGTPMTNLFLTMLIRWASIRRPWATVPANSITSPNSNGGSCDNRRHYPEVNHDRKQVLDNRG